MMNTLVLAWIIILVPASQAKEKFKCGEYSINGIIKKQADHFVVKLYDGTRSEVILSLSKDLEAAAGAFENRSVTIKAKMLAPIKNMRGELHSLSSVDDSIVDRVADPLHAETDSGFDLTKETSCKQPRKK